MLIIKTKIAERESIVSDSLPKKGLVICNNSTSLPLVSVAIAAVADSNATATVAANATHIFFCSGVKKIAATRSERAISNEI
jgi:hypothetical protein